MEQLLIHLFADYWLQNDWMALNKKNRWFPAIVHGVIYTLPFFLLTRSVVALLVIGITHTIIDHTDIVCKLNQIKNWNFRTKSGYSSGRPDFIWVWLIIIQDNILHLIINYLSIKYL